MEMVTHLSYIEMCWFRLEDEFNIMFYLDLDSSKLVHLKSII